MGLHTRTKIQLDTTKDVTEFVKLLNSDGTVDKFYIENFDCSLRVDARSFLGAIYASTEFGKDGLFLVNDTRDGHVPFGIDRFRAV